MNLARLHCVPCTVRVHKPRRRNFSTGRQSQKQDGTNPHLLSIAPMMDYTNKHFRFFMRQITKKTFLYSEMVVSNAIAHNIKDKEKLDRLLSYNEIEHPICLQLGGSEPELLEIATKIGNDYGYDEINLNCGCPSNNVQSGCFGALLMKEPQRVADLTHRMIQSSKVPITVKCRIGVDNQDSYQHLHNFISTVSTSGVKHFVVHARKAWLKGLSPKKNRSVPELNYDFPHKLITDFPHLNFSINGGVKTLSQVKEHLNKGAYGVMIGRQSYKNPLVYFHADSEIYGEKEPQSFLSQQCQLYQNDVERKEGIPIRATKELLKQYSEYAQKDQEMTGATIAGYFKAVEHFVPKPVKHKLHSYKSIKLLLDDSIKLLRE